MKTLYSLLIFALLGTCIYFSEKALTVMPPISKSSQFIKPPLYLEHFTVGHNELMADILWIRAIQDIDHCERKKEKEAACNGSWLGEMLMRISELSPKFRMVYALGPLVLSVMIEDYVSAVKLVEKGTIYYPKDWPILYRGAYIYLYDVKDKKKAAEYFREAGKYGAPSWVFSLASRLLQESGETDQYKILIDEAEKTGVPKEIVERMKRKFAKDQ